MNDRLDACCPWPVLISYTYSSTHFSSFSFPIMRPARIAIHSPVPTYIAATFQPKSPHRRTTATSFTIGEEIRNENVTPRGTPASTKPINRGTAEHEQKGVTTPSSEARIFPINSFLWERMRFVF